MSSEFEEAVIAYAQSLDALGATDAERRRRRGAGQEANNEL